MDQAEPQSHLLDYAQNSLVAKRTAFEEPGAALASKRAKLSHDKSVWPPSTALKPAVLEERNGKIEFRAVNNDGAQESLIIFTGLKCLFQKQLPEMPKDYIACLVYDRTHISIAIIKMPLEVIGGIAFREF
ncbi:hypothetical protein QBC36DRAFT_293426 [Triangularia setosa]|uniref:Histone acetyltransferase n=1 Tax=Triangularia setosa TaxID=2587417 RepID=A0AAN6W1J8_9PEZI|nr:hypothetical protein QBC36DRAFT_293426 [Podospora setosa]